MFCESRFSGRKPQMFLNVCKTLLKLKETNGSSVHKIAQVIFSKFLQLGLKPNPQNIFTQVKRAINFGLKNKFIKETCCGKYRFKSNIPRKLLTVRNSVNLFDSNRHAYRSLTSRKSYEQDKACKKKKTKQKKCKKAKKNKKVKFCEKSKDNNDDNNNDCNKTELKYFFFNPRQLKNKIRKNKLLVEPKNKKAPINVSSDEDFYRHKSVNKNREKLLKPWKTRKPPRPFTSSESKDNDDEKHNKDKTLFNFYAHPRKYKRHHHLRCICKKYNTGHIVKHKPRRKHKIYSKELTTNKVKENKSPHKSEHHDKSENNHIEPLNCSAVNENLDTQEENNA